MGIQLDWQIESERKRRRAVEDPQAKQRRRRQRRQLVAAIVMLAMLVCGVVGGLWWRLRSVENTYRQDLLDTVDAEIRALKVGDEDNFMAIRRSGHEPWLELQRNQFLEYQQLKNDGRIELTGNVLDVEMDLDQSRSRVVVEEIIDDIPFQVVWFYWHYADADQSGWRRVPPDIAFWGEQETIEQRNVRVQYHELDAVFAETLADHLSVWWDQSCRWLGCPVPLESLTVIVEPRSPAMPVWDLNDNWRIMLTSPMYLSRVRRDEKLDADLELRLAQMVATRTLDHARSPDYPFEPVYYTDAAWLYQEYQTWLVGRYSGYVEGSTFIEGLIARYGDDTAATMLRQLGTDSPIGVVLQAATGLSLREMGMETPLDWTSFFQWRLDLEQSFLHRENITEDQVLPLHNSLYDETDSQAMIAADQRRQQNFDGRLAPMVTGVRLSVDEQGRLLATVNLLEQDGTGNVAVFRWMDTTWKRVA